MAAVVVADAVRCSAVRCSVLKTAKAKVGVRARALVMIGATTSVAGRY